LSIRANNKKVDSKGKKGIVEERGLPEGRRGRHERRTGGLIWTKRRAAGLEIWPDRLSRGVS